MKGFLHVKNRYRQFLKGIINMHEQDLLLLILPLLLYVGIVVLFFGESKLLGKLANLSLFPLPVSFQPSLYLFFLVHRLIFSRDFHQMRWYRLTILPKW